MLLPWPWKILWKINVPHKVACFTWLVAREAVLTQDYLMKRGRQLCSRCFLCEIETETTNHLFLQCRVTEKLWHVFFNLRGISVHAKTLLKFSSTLEQRTEYIRSQGEMEDCPCLHLVDNLEGKELEMLRKQEHPFPEFEVEPLCNPLFFGVIMSSPKRQAITHFLDSQEGYKYLLVLLTVYS